MCEGCPRDGVPDMAEARTFYDYEYTKELTWRFTREEIGQDLRERYEVPKELPRKLLTLVRKLDDRPGPSWSSSRRELHNRPPR
jgi:hypothetical protein